MPDNPNIPVIPAGPGPVTPVTPASPGPMTISIDGLDAELKGNKTIAGLAGQPVAKALKMLADAEAMVGRKGAILPKGPDDKEGLAAFRKAIGVPDSPDKYPAVKMPDGLTVDEATDKQFRAWAAELGWTPDQFTGFAERVAAWNVATQRQQQQERQAALDAAKAALKTELGPAYEAQVYLANTAAAAFADEKDLAALREAGLLEHPAFLKLMAKVGQAVAPDRLTQQKGGSVDASGIQSKIDELMRSPAYLTERGPSHDRVLDELMRLRNQLTAAKK